MDGWSGIDATTLAPGTSRLRRAPQAWLVARLLQYSVRKQANGDVHFVERQRQVSLTAVAVALVGWIVELGR